MSLRSSHTKRTERVNTLSALDACSEALDWVRDQKGSNQQLWDRCERPDWMLWLLGREVIQGSQKHRKLVLCVCEIARTRLKYVPEGELRPLRAIKAAESWTKGETTLDQVREAARAAAYAADAAYATNATNATNAASAAYAAYAAAYAAYAAVYADSYAADAAYAAAGGEKCREQCKIVRRIFPKAPRLSGVGK